MLSPFGIVIVVAAVLGMVIIMSSLGAPPARIAQLRAFADVERRKPDSPEDPSNPRISLIVKYAK